MQRFWFKVWVQEQRLSLPVLVEDLPRRARITGNVATRLGRNRALAEVYVLAPSADEARQAFEEVYARLFDRS